MDLRSPAALPRRRRIIAAVGLSALLLGAGCGEDAVTDGSAPEGDGEAPQDPRPQDNEQEAPMADDPDLSGDEEPAVGDDGFSEDTEEQD